MLFNLFITLFACNINPNEPEECIDSSRQSNVEAEIIEVSNSDLPFALSLHNEVLTKSKEKSANLVHSPYSISSALGMLHLGSVEDTKLELESGLGIEDEDIWHSSKGLIVQELHQPDRCDYQLAIANRLFGQHDMEFQTEFLEDTESIYGAPLQEVDFKTNPEGSREIINDWVSEQTMENIPELLKEGIITPLTRLVLTNAIYLNAPWKQAFDPSDTFDMDFTTEDGGIVQVSTMYQSEMDTKRYDDDLVSVANIPYEGDELSISIYLPQDGVSLSDLENTLTDEYLLNIRNSQYSTSSNVSLPKFEIRSPIPLNDPLKNIGMEAMFDGGLENIAVEPEFPLVVTAVVHEAWIKVEEKGTEAAAATAVVIGFTESIPEFDIFTVDRSFLFTIQDDITGSLLFMGRVGNPIE